MTRSEPLLSPQFSRRSIVAGAGALTASLLIAEALGAMASEADAATIRWYHPFSTRMAIRSDFGPRPSPCAGCSSFHKGLDYAPGRLAHIGAAAAGTVIWRRDELSYGQFEANSFGNCVTVDHGGGVQTVYAHLEKGTVAPLGAIPAGGRIGLVGHNGSSTGPHLHIEIRQNNVSIDPEPKINLAPLAPLPLAAPQESDLERLDMLMIGAQSAFKNVTAGYVALVGYKSLHHINRAERDALIKHGGMSVKVMTPIEFEAILTAFQIPITAAVSGANYDGQRVS